MLLMMHCLVPEKKQKTCELLHWQIDFFSPSTSLLSVLGHPVSVLCTGG